ncbi:hypothetical protein F4809DRAFT_628367 [Biscogniauxia mediterranea]|nr:hypothetical protein F4809DRAFT_628367 [Biscogniauxia mediterranea]
MKNITKVFFLTTRGTHTIATKKIEKEGLSDVHRRPPRPRAQRQDRGLNRGRDHHHSLYSRAPRMATLPPSLRTGRE